MGNAWALHVSNPKGTPNPLNEPSFDPQFGFSSPRKERGKNSVFYPVKLTNNRLIHFSIVQESISAPLKMILILINKPKQGKLINCIIQNLFLKELSKLWKNQHRKARIRTDAVVLKPRSSIREIIFFNLTR
jgi:hypothetical protein